MNLPLPRCAKLDFRVAFFLIIHVPSRFCHEDQIIIAVACQAGLVDIGKSVQNSIIAADPACGFERRGFQAGFESFALPPAAPAPVSASGTAAEPLVIIDESPATAPAAHGIPGESLPLLANDGHVRPMETIEADAIRFAIDRYRGRMTEVARRLKIGRSTLYRKLKEFGYEPGPETGEAPPEPAHTVAK